MGQRFSLVRFQGAEYALIGDLEKGGALATQEAYEHCRPSFAHLWPDGRITQYGRRIGRREDLEVLGEVEWSPTREALDHMLGSLAAGRNPFANYG